MTTLTGTGTLICHGDVASASEVQEIDSLGLAVGSIFVHGSVAPHARLIGWTVTNVP